MPERHFPPPWSVEELEACFIVLDASGQKLGYFYFEEEPGRRSSAKAHPRRGAKDRCRRKTADYRYSILMDDDCLPKCLSSQPRNDDSSRASSPRSGDWIATSTSYRATATPSAAAGI